MRFLFLFIFHFFAVGAFAQKVTLENRWSGSVTGALVPFPKLGFGIQPGVEYRFSNRLSLLTEMTIRVGNKTDADSTSFNKQFFRLQPEIRYYLIGTGRRRKNYAGLRLSYSLRKFEDLNKGFYSVSHTGDNGFFYDRAKISSPIFTTSLQTGTIYPIGKKTSLDIFLGLGVRFINTHYSDVVNPVSGLRDRPADGPIFYPSYDFEKRLTRIQVNTGIRLLSYFR